MRISWIGFSLSHNFLHQLRLFGSVMDSWSFNDQDGGWVSKLLREGSKVRFPLWGIIFRFLKTQVGCKLKLKKLQICMAIVYCKYDGKFKALPLCERRSQLYAISL